MDKKIKVGDLVKDKWSSITKIHDWKKQKYNICVNYYIPPIGFIKKIKKVTVYRTKIVNKKKEKIRHTIEVAEIDWMSASIPEMNGITSKWELTHYRDFRYEMEIKDLISYEQYYKRLLKRLHKKSP